MEDSAPSSFKSLKQQLMRIMQHLSALSLIEFKSAMLAMVWIGGAALGIVFLLFIVWLLTMMTLTLFLLHHGLACYAVILVVASLQLLLMIPLLWLIVHYSKKLLFPKTQQALDVLIN